MLRVRKQFKALANLLKRTVVSENAFGLTTNKFQFGTDSNKVDAFTEWIKEQAKETILGKSDEKLWEEYAKAAMQKGASKSFDDVNAGAKAEAEGSDGPDALPFYKGGKSAFLNDSFRQPVAVDKLKILSSRSFTDLKGVTDDMAVKMRRTLVDGLARGDNPRALGDDLAKELGISSRRAETIARTEIIRAHSEGQLLALERMGVNKVGVDVEWSTAGDDRVCPICESMEGKVFSIDEAHGQIPAHPNCRCAWLPYLGNLGESDEPPPEADPTESPVERCQASVEDQRAKFEADLEALDQQNEDDTDKLQEELALAKDRLDNEQGVLDSLQENLTGDEEDTELQDSIDSQQDVVDAAQAAVDDLEQQLEELPAQQAEDRQQLEDDQAEQLDELQQRCDEIEEMAS